MTTVIAAAPTISDLLTGRRLVWSFAGVVHDGLN
jgi:hypothetical protein